MVKVPYAVGVPLDNLVLEVEDLNVEENPQSLSIALYRGPEADGKCTGRSGSCTQEQLQELTPLRTVSDARARIFSFGLSSIEMQEYICGGTCTSSGTFRLNLVVRCTSSHVRFQAISILTPLILDRGVPVHGEVCPGNWIYHKTFIPDNDKYHDASGVRFNVHVHQGDIYYMITRWDHSPGFAACNENEVAMSFQRDGHADLCHLTEKFECTFSEADKAAAAANGTELSLIGYIGLYWGTLALALTLSLALALALTLSNQVHRPLRGHLLRALHDRDRAARQHHVQHRDDRHVRRGEGVRLARTCAALRLHPRLNGQPRNRVTPTLALGAPWPWRNPGPEKVKPGCRG